MAMSDSTVLHIPLQRLFQRPTRRLVSVLSLPQTRLWQLLRL